MATIPSGLLFRSGKDSLRTPSRSEEPCRRSQSDRRLSSSLTWQSGGPKSSVDDLCTGRGVVLGRAATTLRSIETQPFDWHDLSCQLDKSRQYCEGQGKVLPAFAAGGTLPFLFAKVPAEGLVPFSLERRFFLYKFLQRGWYPRERFRGTGQGKVLPAFCSWRHLAFFICQSSCRGVGTPPRILNEKFAQRSVRFYPRATDTACVKVYMKVNMKVLYKSLYHKSPFKSRFKSLYKSPC